MADKCVICVHPDAHAINEALVSGMSGRRIAAKYGVSETTLRRHKEHLPAHIAESQHAEVVTRADSLVDDLQGLRRQALDFLNMAKESGSIATAAPLITAACRVIETLAEVRGELDRRATVNIFLNPEFQMVQGIILRELEDYPDVRHRIALALEEVKHD